MIVNIDLHPEVLAAALEVEEVIKEQEDKELDAKIAEMAARSIAQEGAHKNEMASKEQSVKQENHRIVRLMKNWANWVDGVYVGLDHEISDQIIEDVADAVLTYTSSDKTYEDKLMFMVSKAGKFISIDYRIEVEKTFSFWNTENEKRLQTATVHNH
ncbi:hypothetical protein P4482_15180 [Neobacillus thermocopriae]|jgi:choline kinase|uniref:hypothetical protein n=1 Tax=Neobacillus thermocopriae TaxID=1215031 RepID=UPI002E1AF5A3|nr:hypothetical protein [Neobacillus thermocopriae]MED3715530.1 hypothetical protein [Neobacillus thermocopriae]